MEGGPRWDYRVRINYRDADAGVGSNGAYDKAEEERSNGCSIIFTFAHDWMEHRLKAQPRQSNTKPKKGEGDKGDRWDRPR
jgi:hypothetical protein